MMKKAFSFGATIEMLDAGTVGWRHSSGITEEGPRLNRGVHMFVVFCGTHLYSQHLHFFFFFFFLHGGCSIGNSV